MRTFLIFAALCAICAAAPTPDVKQTELTRPSPINPAVLSDPKPAEKVVPTDEAKLKHEKRVEAPPAIPDSIKATEGLKHNPSRPVRPLVQPLEGHEQKQKQQQTQKREAHHEPGHKSADAAVKSSDATTHKHEHEHEHKAVAAVIKPAEVHTHDHAAHAHNKRDIPVPTEVKTTPKPKESHVQVEDLHDHVPHSATDSSTEHPAIRHHPVPVAELFARPKQAEKESSA